MNKYILSLWLLSLVVFLTGCSSTPEPTASHYVEPEEEIETLENLELLSRKERPDYPQWIFLPPEEEGYLYGVGSDSQLDLAKAKSLVSVGQQFDTRVRSVLVEKSVSGGSKEETSTVSSISEQVTDQALTGAKYFDQYIDDDGQHWVLARAPYDCVIDAVESILISYSLELQQNQNQLVNVVDLLEEAIEKPLVDTRTTLYEDLVLAGDFWISRYEVSRADWLDVMGSLPEGLVKINSEPMPVGGVSWFEAISFCNAASLRDGLTPAYAISEEGVTCFFDAGGYRLPTEQEWEFAASGGFLSRGALYSGYNRPELSGWSSENSEGQVHPSAELNPNELGLYDMSGNLWEWCWDPVENIVGTEVPARIVKGGSWNYSPEDMIVKNRGKVHPDDRYDEIGFRIVKSVR